MGVAGTSGPNPVEVPMSKISPAKMALVEAVKAHAEANYTAGGWDVIVECWDDEQIAETIGRARTVAGALAAFAPLIDVWADRQAEAASYQDEAEQDYHDSMIRDMQRPPVTVGYGMTSLNCQADRHDLCNGHKSGNQSCECPPCRRAEIARDWDAAKAEAAERDAKPAAIGRAIMEQAAASLGIDLTAAEAVADTVLTVELAMLAMQTMADVFTPDGDAAVVERVNSVSGLVYVAGWGECGWFRFGQITAGRDLLAQAAELAKPKAAPAVLTRNLAALARSAMLDVLTPGGDAGVVTRVGQVFNTVFVTVSPGVGARDRSGWYDFGQITPGRDLVTLAARKGRL